MLKFSGWSYFTSDDDKLVVSEHWAAEAAATFTLNEFTLENVTAALSVMPAQRTGATAKRRVLSCLATEGHLSH